LFQIFLVKSFTVYREAESHALHHKTSKHKCMRFGSSPNPIQQLSKQPFLRGKK